MDPCYFYGERWLTRAPPRVGIILGGWKQVFDVWVCWEFIRNMALISTENDESEEIPMRFSQNNLPILCQSLPHQIFGWKMEGILWHGEFFGGIPREVPPSGPTPQRNGSDGIWFIGFRHCFRMHWRNLWFGRILGIMKQVMSNSDDTESLRCIVMLFGQIITARL